MYNDELMHYGIKGMKWGRRRYQNKDGTLTPAGRKRVSKEYKKESIMGDQDLQKSYNKMYMDSWNKAADHMNNGGIDKFNRAQEKKYGKNYSKRDGYDDDFQKLFDKKFNENLSKSLLDFRISNEHYQKADALIKEYEMTSWDELARSNHDAVETIRRAVRGA